MDRRFCILVIFAGYEAINLVYTPQIHDLTLLYGAGNEPSTVEEFQQQFPAQYYPYNAGTLLSAGVTGVKSVGINVWDEQWEVGGVNVTTGIKDRATDRIRSKNFIPVQSGVSYYFNGLPLTENMVVLCYRYDKTYTGTYYYRNVNQPTETLPQGTAFILFYMVGAYGTTYRHDICIHVSSASTNGNYYPYNAHTYPIPAEIQALEGYGWSAGSVYNYIDYERKVFVQNVGSRAYASGDESDSTVVTDMTTTYYPLNPAVETDISQYLTDDNLIEVEAGGSLTFPNSNGTDYQIPVPSAETYMVDLQASL